MVNLFLLTFFQFCQFTWIDIQDAFKWILQSKSGWHNIRHDVIFFGDRRALCRSVSVGFRLFNISPLIHSYYHSCAWIKLNFLTIQAPTDKDRYFIDFQKKWIFFNISRPFGRQKKSRQWFKDSCKEAFPYFF
jgi:hypothetical protein